MAVVRHAIDVNRRAAGIHFFVGSGIHPLAGSIRVSLAAVFAVTRVDASSIDRPLVRRIYDARFVLADRAFNAIVDRVAYGRANLRFANEPGSAIIISAARCFAERLADALARRAHQADVSFGAITSRDAFDAAGLKRADKIARAVAVEHALHMARRGSAGR